MNKKFKKSVKQNADSKTLNCINHKRFTKTAFSLAEVLITLGIIGVVASLTIPSLIQSYKKQVVETRLAKFYSVINQAIRLSDMENGEFVLPKSEYSIEDFYNKRLEPYIQTIKTKKTNKYSILVYFPDGSAMEVTNQDGVHTVHIDYFPVASKKDTAVYGKDKFFFHFSYMGYSRPEALLFPYGIQPYSWRENGWKGLTDEEIDNILSDSCNDSGIYCTAVIMRNGWKIPKDFPFKF